MSIDLRRLASCMLALCACACTADEMEPEGGIAVGLLLPFTGSASATASNLERATLFAVDRVNQAGGIDGVPLRLVSRDTHSGVSRGVSAARALADEGVIAVIGPESAEIAEAIEPVLAERGVLFLSPLVGAATEFGGPDGRACATPWFRLAPSATTLGEALAKQAQAQTKRVAIFHTTSPYDDALGTAAASRFKALGGEVVLELELDPNAQSYATAVRSGIAAGVTDVILAASPRAAAIVVNEFDALSSKKPHWYLSPLLKTELLVQNVAPQALEGAVGIAPKIYERGIDFPEAFSARWLGDQPLEGAYFYFDAVMLLAVSLAKADYQSDGEPVEPKALSEAMLDVAGPPGEVMSWDELEEGLSRLSAGEDLYYTGLTGPLGLATFQGSGGSKRTCGKRSIGQTSNWTVVDGAIIDVDD
jgi:ABC-type branched-subunit amino acid transport system substrate-binding protein